MEDGDIEAKSRFLWYLFLLNDIGAWYHEVSNIFKGSIEMGMFSYNWWEKYKISILSPRIEYPGSHKNHVVNTYFSKISPFNQGIAKCIHLLLIFKRVFLVP